MIKRNAVIFDLDGTLLNTLDDLADSMNYALEQCGYPIRTVKEIRSFIGGGATLICRRSVPEGTSEEDFEHCKKIFLDHYKKNSNNKTDLYDGIRPLVKKLAEEGYKLAVHSNKGDLIVKQLIASYFGDQVQVAMGEQPDIPRKPAPDAVYKVMEHLGSTKEETIYIGDSDVDVKTARNAGVPCITVTWGFRDRDVLEAEHPAAIVDTTEELYQSIHALDK